MIDLARVAAHELGHALVGRAQGYRIRTVWIVPGSGSLGACEHFPRTDLGPFEDALASAVTDLAGEIAGRLVVVPAGYHEPGRSMDGAAERAIATLPRDEAAFISWYRSVPSSGSDAEKAAQLADVAGAEKAAFLYFAETRAHRLVTEMAPLIGALIPVLVKRLVMTGDEIEQAIVRSSKESQHA